eukprot:RCo052251
MFRRGYVRDPYSPAGIKELDYTPLCFTEAAKALPETCIRTLPAPGGPLPHHSRAATAAPTPSTAAPAAAPFVPLPGVVLPVVVSCPLPSPRPTPHPLPRRPFSPPPSRPPMPVSPAVGDEPWPCPHNNRWRRLRSKKGLNHFLCTQCEAKWKGSDYFLQFMGRRGGGYQSHKG